MRRDERAASRPLLTPLANERRGRYQAVSWHLRNINAERQLSLLPADSFQPTAVILPINGAMMKPDQFPRSPCVFRAHGY